MAKYNTLNALFTAIANSLRGKTGGSGKIVADDFPTVIDGLSTGGITPSGTKNITSNGTYDVSSYASAAVNVPTPAQMTVVRTITLASDVVGAQPYKLLDGDMFIKAHYADEGFSAAIIPLAPVAMEANVVHFNYHGNRNIGASNKVYYGVGLRSTSASAIGNAVFNNKINGKGYTQHMRVDSTGALYQYLHTDYILKAGTYLIVLTCTTE